MQTITTIGLDIAKSVFQVHGVDANGQVVIRRQLKRRSVLAFFQKLPPCLVGIEACASSSLVARTPCAGSHRAVDTAGARPYSSAALRCVTICGAEWTSCNRSLIPRWVNCALAALSP
jgi:hypothetical protein